MAVPATPRSRRSRAVLGRSSLLACSSLLWASAGSAAPLATYTIEARTSSGMAAAASGPAMMQMLTGQGTSPTSRTLSLTLESRQAASGVPQAEHLIPQGLGLGTSLPLESASSAVSAGTLREDSKPDSPKGRMLVFRGCAGTPGADQPQVIDFAALMPDQRLLAQSLASRRGGGEAKSARGDSRVTVGSWPSGDRLGTLPEAASLVGDHRVRSNYAPDISFRVDPSHDFLAALRLQLRRTGEAMDLSWAAIPGSLGFQAMASGAGTSGDVVLWTSSTAPWSESGVPSDLDAATARRLQSQGVLLPPEQIRCSISPAALKQLGEGMVQLTAYGASLRLAAPAGSPGWTVTLQRDSVSNMPMMEMPGLNEAPDQRQAPQAPGTGGGWRLLPGLF